jgi:hypothetical protein
VPAEIGAHRRSPSYQFGEFAGGAQDGEYGRHAAGLAAVCVFVGERVQLALGGEFALDEVDAGVMVDRDVHDGDAACDALRLDGALSGGNA